MMKKLFLGTVGLIALGMAPASAADMAARPYTKAPPPMVAAVYDWSGFYIGLNGGGGWSHKCFTNTNDLGIATIPNVSEGCHDASGGIVGGQLGYRWQSASWVFGLEAQGDWADLKGSNASRFIAGATNQTKINALGLFTGQVGYAWNNVLWYVKGGAAVTDDHFSGVATATGVAFDRANDARWGAAVGTGVEFAFAPSWSLGFEYDHLFMGNRDITLTTTLNGAISRTDRIGQDVDMATVRVNYRWGGPSISKY
jgi:outer membrane immunogenic protein